MEYGKMALSQIEEIRQLLIKTASKAPRHNIIQINKNADVSFSGKFSFSESFKTLSEGAVGIDMLFNIDSPSAAQCVCSVFSDGCEVTSVNVGISQGKGQYQARFALNTPALQYRLTLIIDFGDTVTRTLSNLSVSISGDVSAVNASSKLVVSDENSLTKISYNDDDYVYYTYLDGETLVQSKRFSRRGDYTFCACNHEGSDQFDVIYFYTDEGKLFMYAMPYHSNFVSFRMLLDENVTSVSAASLTDGGCVLFYLKGGVVYCIGAEKNVLHNTVLAGKSRAVASAMTAVKVSSVRGLPSGCGFVLTEKNKRNGLYLCFQEEYKPSADTVVAVITRGIEGLV